MRELNRIVLQYVYIEIKGVLELVFLEIIGILVIGELWFVTIVTNYKLDIVRSLVNRFFVDGNFCILLLIR